MRKTHITLILLFLTSSYIYSYTIEDKRIDLSKAESNNSFNYEEKNLQIKHLYKQLEDAYMTASSSIAASADDENFFSLAQNIQVIRDEISDVENAWKDSQTDDFNKGDSNSSLWEHGEISISKLIIEYGSHESLYVIPPEIAKLKIAVHCLLPIPKESWPKMIELILIHNNIAVKKINPFLKQLYFLKDDYTNIDMVTSETHHLDILDANSRIIFIYSPPLENIKTSYYFLDRFKNAKTTYLYQVGSKVAIVGLIKDIKKLISLAETVWDKNEERVSKILSPQRVSPSDAVKLLKNYFGGLTDYSKPLISMKGGNGLSAFTLKGESSLILIGSKEIVSQAEHIIRQTEGQVHDPSEVILYWHTCSHCNPTELAEILSKVYHSLNACNIEGFKKSSVQKSSSPYRPGMHRPLASEKSISTTSTESTSTAPNTQQNFFPYPETGSILMTIRKDSLNKIKEIIKKIDQPKKMVEIEVLLCERRITNSNKSGINLLKLANAASGSMKHSAGFNSSASGGGIMEFLFSRESDLKRCIPAIDLTYNFLLSQDDIMVTASPSTTTLNQVPTTLSITDQISIHTGTNSDDSKATYNREDFGITLTLTPTIHARELDAESDTLFITLDNDIKFETITSNIDAHPTVHKRHIKNTVRIPDGETIIIGGLRSNSTEENNRKIPFLGEIPGFAKIFGSSQSTNINSEMFIFIKPTIISDPKTDLLRLRDERLRNRPGDTEMLLRRINESRKNQKQRRFHKSFNMLFGSGNIDEQTL